jgi:thiamine-phosphate pyrophosphorylase
MRKLCGLYVITDEKLTPYKTIEHTLEIALQHGASMVQLRDKTRTTEELVPVALKLKTLCRRYNRLFIVNDNTDLAIKTDADGVHIGKDDLHITTIRKQMAGKIIGVSCYGDIVRAQQVEQDGADYVAFGSFFLSSTKPQASVVAKKILTEAKKQLKIPVCAIGGITVDNAHELVAMGADMIAVIGGIFGQGSVADNAARFTVLFS